VHNFQELGAHVIKGSFFEDQKVIDEALTGAKAFYWQAPPMSSPDFQEWIYAAARRAVDSAVAHGVHRVVVLSSIGGQVGAETGFLNSYRELEAIFKAKIQHVTILRPGSFTENFLRDIPTLASQGVVYSALGDFPLRFPIVATSDIAKKAASYLLTDNWQGQHTVGVHGPKDYSVKEQWQVISKAIGKDIKVVNISLEQLGKALEEHHVPKFFADAYVEFQGAFLNGKFWNSEPRSPETTTSTSLFEWAQTVFKPALEAASKK